MMFLKLASRASRAALVRAPVGAFGAPALYKQLLVPVGTRASARGPLLMRFYASSVDEPAPFISYKDVVELIKKNDPNIVIVDTREPEEYNEGHIPSALNIPFRSSPGALGLDKAEFKDTFGFDKPSTDQTLVFYCARGVRSAGSEQLAATYGYKKRLDYKGSFEDWSNNKGEIVHEAAKEEEKPSS